jgi:2-polyprenyl-3-methyl-5-hydroxy-6-metoxy-1,4-benzoquinol methylase
VSSEAVETYGWGSTQAPGSCGYITPKVVDLLARLPAKRVLDLGSGNGALCAHVSTLGYSVVGVEYDAEGVRVAQAAYPSVHFYNFGVQDDPAELLQSELPFDAVISTEVVEHLFAPHLLPAYARAVLKPGGHLIVSTPYHGYLKNLMLSVFGKWDKHFTALWHGGHIKFWSQRSLTQLLEAQGFEFVSFSGVGRLPYLWKSMIVVARLRAQ